MQRRIFIYFCLATTTNEIQPAGVERTECLISRKTNLIKEQKDLLNQYITSFADDGFELRVYLNEELGRLKSLVKATSENTSAPLISQKLNEVSEYLEEFRKRDFTDGDLNKILKTQELVQELT